MHDCEAFIGNNPMVRIGKGSRKFWYFVVALFVLWLLLLLNSYYSELWENDFEIPDHNQKLNSVVVQGKNGINVPQLNPIDNFFIGGDWDLFFNETGKKQPNSSGHLKENEAQSTTKVVGKEENFDNGIELEEKIVTGSGSDFNSGSDSDSDSDSCSGKYIYMHDLPSQFNQDLIKHCDSLSEWSDMCQYISNSGLGPVIRNSEKILSNEGWFETNQFMLEVIFHNRMKKYNCLTNYSSLASAIFVPYYAGLDVARYLWNSSSASMRDFYSISLVNWLKSKPEWKKLWGRDHFSVAGRITWDFRRLTDENSDWGNKLLLLPETRNMTMLTIESSPWSQNDYAIPYPTYFHPSSNEQILQWQRRMRRTKRRFLFSFAGAPRPNLTDSIRNEIIQQCQAAKRKCKMLNCFPGSNKCYKPIHVMKIFESSVFCLQPAGDSYTRRSTFDSILAGCIPVFFHPGSAYVQYLWHLPKDYTKYSVFIPGNDVKIGKASIERRLSRISKAKIVGMREEVIKLIPGVVYADPRSSLKNLEDAFDITVEGVLERVEKIREDIKQGNDVSDDGEEFSWKKNLFGTVEKHEWDSFFDRS